MDAFAALFSLIVVAFLIIWAVCQSLIEIGKRKIASPSPLPMKFPKTEEEIQAVLVELKRLGYLPDSTEREARVEALSREVQNVLRKNADPFKRSFAQEMGQGFAALVMLLIGICAFLVLGLCALHYH
jgi:hypothetical protein